MDLTMFNKLIFNVLVFATLALSVSAEAEELSQSKYDEKAQLCEICHQNGNDAFVPHLAGQSTEYILKQFERYKNGERKSGIMTTVVNSFQSESEMRAVADYFSKQPPKRTHGGSGEAFYSGKHMFEQTYACAGCHGFDGMGKVEPTLVVPMLAGQKKDYLVQRLVSFREAEHDEGNPMTRVAKKLTDEDIAVVAGYLSDM